MYTKIKNQPVIWFS